jgi:hypothetical protein
MMSTPPLLSTFLYVNGEPHVPQKLRMTGADERNSTGAPRVIANFSARNTTNGSDGADALLRHVSQWQMPLASGSPSTR